MSARHQGSGRGRPADTIDAQIGARLRTLRIRRGLSQIALGEAGGVAYQQISKYERGKDRIALSVAMRLCRALETPVEVLTMGIDMGEETVESLRARLLGRLDALEPDDWAILPRADVERAFGPAPHWPHLPRAYCVLDEGSERDLLVLREGGADGHG